MNKISILHIEDDPNDAELILTELRSGGYETNYTRVDNKKDFVEQLEQNKFDIILADYKLPNFDGFSALKICSEKYSDIPFIFISGTLGEENAVKALLNGASDFLIKQNLIRLNSAIDRALKESIIKQEKYKIEQDLKTSEEKFRSITENSADAIFISNRNREFLFSNNAATVLLGYSSDEILEKKIEDLAPDANHAKIMLALFNQLLLDGKVTGEIYLLKKDGSSVPVDVNATIFPNNLLYGSCREITNRKKVETALLASEKKYRSIFENTQDVFYQIDINSIITEMSPSIKRISGYSREELIGKPSTIFYNNTSDRELLLNELKEKGEVWDHEILLKRKDNLLRYASINAHYMLDNENNPIGIEGSLRDIDDRKQSEIKLEEAKEKAEESDRLKTAFLSNISHEIRTPLNGILGFSDMLVRDNLDDNKREMFLDIIRKSGNQLLSIIDDIIDISKIETDQIRIEQKFFNLIEIMDYIYELFKQKNNQQNVKFEYVPGIESKTFFIESDQAKLLQIVSNLLNNSFKFTFKGFIRYGFTIKESEIEFFVSDSGIGIAPENQTIIFDRFRQVEEGASRNYGGTGLGLSISKALVEKLGGIIWIESQLNTGSTFYFTIPLKVKDNLQNHSIETDSNSYQPKLNSNATILIVDDEESNYLYLKEIIDDLNIKNLKATNGLEAIEMVKKHPEIKLILMDIKMPILNGYKATTQIKELNPNIIIIAQTAYAQKGDKEKAINSGCDDYISKPIKEIIILDLIKKYFTKL